MFQHKFRPSEVVLVGQKEHKKGNYDLCCCYWRRLQIFVQGSSFVLAKGQKISSSCLCNRFGDCIFQTKDLDVSSKKRWVFLFLFCLVWGLLICPAK